MPPRSRPRHPRLRTTLIVSVCVVIGLAVAWFATALALFVFPRQQPLHEADAVVSLSPPAERLPAARAAFDDGLASRLWVSYVPRDFVSADERTLVDETCKSGAPHVACFAPVSNDTIGEARAVAKLVEETGAKSVIVTTHTSHAARTRFLFEHCLPKGTEVQLLMVDEPQNPLYLFGRMLYETGAFAKAVTQVHLCDQ